MILQKTNTNTNSRIIFLDYLRIFAFSSVIIGHHFYDSMYAYALNPETATFMQGIMRLLLPFFYCGGAGVVVFFFVSGYVITHVLQNEKTINFIIKRIFRIYPLYMVAVLIQNTNSLIKCIFIPGLLTERLPTLLSQLFLVGDFFGTNYSLYGIEWTLRVEILFYLYMAILHRFNIFHAHKKLLPYILVASGIFLAILPPFPTWNETNMATVTLYGPFLLLGVAFYIAEKKQVHYFFLAGFSIFVFFEYFMESKILQPRWSESPFSILAFVIFLSAWLLKNKLVVTRFVLTASDLTYAAYLFHSWHYDAINKFLIRNNFIFINTDVMTLFLLLIICIFSVKFIEKPGILLGRIIIRLIDNNLIRKS